MPNRSGIWSLRQAGVNEVNELWKDSYPNPRALFAGGRNRAGGVDHSNFIDSVEIGTTGNTSDFGDLAVSVYDGAGGIASATRGVFHGGQGSSARIDSIEYVTIASAGNGTDFGDLSAAKDRVAGCSSGTRGIVSGGNTANTTFIDVIEYVTIASTGDVTDFGNLTANKSDQSGNVASPTRGVFKGGQVNSSSTTDTIDYITIASTGNATDFGDATYASQGGGGCANATQGIFFGGTTTNSNNSGGVVTIEKITIATTGNAADFGDITGHPSGQATYYAVNMAGASSSTRGVLAGNAQEGVDITYITFSSDGNSSTFGEFTNTRGETGGIGGLSGAHGGIG
jgi:hypothetical protein